MYADRIDTARKAVAIAMAVCGAGLVVCVRQDDYLTGTLRCEPGIWRWGACTFGVGVSACSVATLALILEYLARPTPPSPFVWRSFFARATTVVVVIAGVGLALAFLVGPGQGIGAAIATTLLLAALREHGEARVGLAVVAAIALGLMLWSMLPANERRVEKGGVRRAAQLPLPVSVGYASARISRKGAKLRTNEDSAAFAPLRKPLVEGGEGCYAEA